MIDSTLKGVIAALKMAENLKTELRHSWLSDGRQESVAEHTWRLSLMALMLEPYLDQKVDILKCLKLSIVHDLGEAKAGDVPCFQSQTADAKMEKFEAEKEGMQELCSHLSKDLGQEIYDIWLEYEECETYEAKFIKALDKLEAHLQHNEADLSTWSDIEYVMWFQSKWMKDHCQFDSTLQKMAEIIKEEAMVKMEQAGKDLTSLEKEAA